MVDEPQVDEPQVNVESMTADEIEKQVNLRTKRNTCPFCDNKDWYVLANLPGQPFTTGVILSSGTGPVPAHTLFCTNCGFVRQHVTAIASGKLRVPEPSS